MNAARRYALDADKMLSRVFVSRDGKRVAESLTVGAGDEIVLRCNAHDDLVAALKRIAGACRFDEGLYGHCKDRRVTGTTVDIAEVLRLCESALAKVQG
jgi:hypothetical protein